MHVGMCVQRTLCWVFVYMYLYGCNRWECVPMHVLLSSSSWKEYGNVNKSSFNLTVILDIFSDYVLHIFLIC